MRQRTHSTPWPNCQGPWYQEHLVKILIICDSGDNTELKAKDDPRWDF